MKKTFLLLVTALVFFSATQIFAQSKSNPEEVIIIEFLIPNRDNYERYEVPINKTYNKDNEIGGGSVSECLDYTGREEICNKNYSSYDFTANATLKSKNESWVVFDIEVTDGCKTRKRFTVNRNRQTKIRLNCGVSLIAYYGFESEEVN